MPLNQKTDIRALYGVGNVRAQAYERLGISNIGDLLCHYPKRYENRGDIKMLADTSPDEKSATVLTVATEPRVSTLKNRLSLLKFRAYDESGICEIIYFNQNFLRSVFSVGTQFRFYGKVERKGKNFSLSSPVYEPYFENVPLPTLVPVYPLTEGLTQKQINKDINTLFSAINFSDISDSLPEQIRHEHSLCTISYALKNIHHPESFIALAKAKKRLIFDEFFTFAAGLALSREKNKKTPAYPCADTDISPLLALLPYNLTGAQCKAINEIRSDMSRDCAMSRILVGDVGCGKTICAAAAIYIAVKNGKQAALMVPTEILAVQHYNDLKLLFSQLGIKCKLLTSSVKKSKKNEIYASLSTKARENKIDVIIGTQALLSDGVSFDDLGLIVTDEQHRFGVNQRSLLSLRNDMSHVLIMSATPIPRSMALAIYGDLDLSLIDEMPAGRQKVDTFVVNESYRERLNTFIRKQINEGGQVYIVCPAVEEKDDDDEDVGNIDLSDIDDNGEIKEKPALKAAVQFAEEISNKFADFNVKHLHGKMKPAEKNEVMMKFADGDIDILVSTTVIEVGVNVPNASLMIVENAERFGLAQLHQLRGRVGRGNRKSFCILVSEAKNETSTARLEVMRTTYDGYKISEKDLEMRGPGDFLRSGDTKEIRQSGEVHFKLAQMCDDTGLMKAAFASANTLIEQSNGLSDYPEILSSVEKMFSHTILS